MYTVRPQEINSWTIKPRIPNEYYNYEDANVNRWAANVIHDTNTSELNSGSADWQQRVEELDLNYKRHCKLLEFCQHIIKHPNLAQ